MKIDVEGYEGHVLEGARRTITRDRPVLVVEIRGGSNYDTADAETRGAIDAVRNLMRSLGYVVTRVSEQDYLGTPIPAVR